MDFLTASYVSQTKGKVHIILEIENTCKNLKAMQLTRKRQSKKSYCCPEGVEVRPSTSK